MTATMQIRRTGSREYGRHLKTLICGESGAGKTRIASTFPNPFYASAEGGLMSIADRNIPYVEIRSTDDLLRIKNALDQSADVREQLLGFPVDTLVIDTIDEVQRILIRERLEETKKESMQLQDWGWLGEQMQAIIRGLRNLDMNVVLLSHTKETNDSETGRMFIKPQMQGAICDQLPAFVDLSLLLRTQTAVSVVDGEARKTTIRVLQTYPDAQHGWVKDRSGKLPMEVPVDFDTDYKRIAAMVFGGVEELEDPDPTPLKEPTVVAFDPVPTAPGPSPADPISTPEMTLVDSSKPVVPKPNGPALPAERAARKKPEPEPPIELLLQHELPDRKPEDTPQEQVPEEPTVITCSADPCLGSGVVESVNQKDLSLIRFRKVLCKACHMAQKRK